jgi:nucleotide-binding universal stress UspA family protein
MFTGIADQHESTEPRDVVVVGVDGSTANDAAIRWAADEATKQGCPLEILTIVDENYSTSPYVTITEVNKVADSILAGAAALARQRQPGIEVMTEKRFGHASRALRSAGRGARMLVLGRRGRGRFARMLLGSVSSSVGTHAETPTAVIPAQWTASEAADAVVVGIDGSPSSTAALMYAAGLAVRDMSELRVTHVWGPESLFTAESVMAYGGLAAWRKEADEFLTMSIAPVRAQFPELKVVEVLHQGQPVHSLTDQATADRARALVVGAHPAPRVAAQLVGSTTHGVLYYADCPVIVVPEQA